MATDKSQPRVGLIFKIGLFSIVVLVVVHTALVSYFDKVAQAEDLRKNGDVKPEALMNMRADEKGRLATGAMPIDKAMQQMVARGRASASPDIMPYASKDIAPLQGWSKMPGEVPGPMTAEPPPARAPVLDGGAGSRPDGGVPKGNKTARPDAGRAALPQAT
ncbi:MAG: hypothetical protein WBY94_16940 [Polyangiaceae bacterium]|jgi:hypothetical protein